MPVLPPPLGQVSIIKPAPAQPDDGFSEQAKRLIALSALLGQFSMWDVWVADEADKVAKVAKPAHLTIGLLLTQAVEHYARWCSPDPNVASHSRSDYVTRLVTSMHNGLNACCLREMHFPNSIVTNTTTSSIITMMLAVVESTYRAMEHHRNLVVEAATKHGQMPMLAVPENVAKSEEE
jgi:hypothetical protein